MADRRAWAPCRAERARPVLSLRRRLPGALLPAVARDEQEQRRRVSRRARGPPDPPPRRDPDGVGDGRLVRAILIAQPARAPPHVSTSSLPSVARRLALAFCAEVPAHVIDRAVWPGSSPPRSDRAVYRTSGLEVLLDTEGGLLRAIPDVEFSHPIQTETLTNAAITTTLPPLWTGCPTAGIPHLPRVSPRARLRSQAPRTSNQHKRQGPFSPEGVERSATLRRLRAVSKSESRTALLPGVGERGKGPTAHRRDSANLAGVRSRLCRVQALPSLDSLANQCLRRRAVHVLQARAIRGGGDPPDDPGA